jgi:hypothetical protein
MRVSEREREREREREKEGLRQKNKREIVPKVTSI